MSRRIDPCLLCKQADDENDPRWGEYLCQRCGLPTVWDDGTTAWEATGLTKSQREAIYAAYELAKSGESQ